MRFCYQGLTSLDLGYHPRRVGTDKPSVIEWKLDQAVDKDDVLRLEPSLPSE